MWEQIRVAYTQISDADRPASGSLEIICKPSRAGRALKKKAVNTRSDSLKERSRQQNREAHQTVRRMTMANKSGPKGKTGYTWRAKQTRPLTGENKERCKMFAKLVREKYGGATYTLIDCG